MSQPNQEQIEFWSGIAGDRWVAAQEMMDRTIRPLGDAALRAAALAPGLRVLDVGCGCGDTTLAAARAVGPSGHVTGVDVSPQMLARARERAAAERGAAPMTFAFGDAATADLPTVERIVSRFGVMFFADPIAAFTHLRGALAPGGRMAFVCWRAMAENPWARIPTEAVATVLGPAAKADPTAPGPFAFADAARVRGILASAGFGDVATAPFDAPLTWTTGDTDQELRETFVRVGAAARRLVDVPDAVREPAIAAILAALAPYRRPTGLVLDGAVWVVTATA
jgi:SAM-dependent methyltransferase